jgi:acetoin utilization deacetylase AcuC-like enzyme
MAEEPPIRVVSDSRFLDHRGPDGHPECPERLLAVSRVLAEFEDSFESVMPREATREEILRVHERAHWDRIRQSAGAGEPTRLDPDTYACRDSFEVAKLAAGAAVNLVRDVAEGRARAGVAAVRPPGHHAESDRAMGFCLFNNIAIAARALQTDCGLDKVMIIDWDVHHGNGTQHSFEDDPSLLYLSTHQFPFYPGTGDFAEAGRAGGEGTTVNIPMPAGCGDVEYIGVFRRLVAPVARHFRPEMILVSCGFDAHAEDPLASMCLTRDGFAAMTASVCSLADELCGSRIVFVLEGGYSERSLMDGTRAVLAELSSETPARLGDAAELTAGSNLRTIVDRVAAVHGTRFPDLGSA